MKFGKFYRCILFGGGDLLLETARYLIDNNFEVQIIISDRQYREKLLLNPDITFEDHINNNQFVCHLSKDLSERQLPIQDIGVDVIVLSFWAVWIFNKEIIGRFSGRLLNLHGSRIPQDRGGGGVSWRILRGDKGVNIAFKLRVGDRCYTKQSKLEEALQYRATYTPSG